MDTKQIYIAQLNVSKYYTQNTINDLVSKLSFIGEETYYNEKNKTIDINCNRVASIEDDCAIRQTIKEWIKTLPIENKDIDVMIENIDFIFNITKLTYPNLDKHIINVYLY